MNERRMKLEQQSSSDNDRLVDIMGEAVSENKEKLNEGLQESKINELRNRVKILKDKRQAEERQFVKQKRDQVFQNQCEAIRTLFSQKMAKDIAQDWGEQIKMKSRLRLEEEETERMFAHLMKIDEENKWKREHAYDCIRAEANKKALLELKQQIQYKKAFIAGEAGKIKAVESALNSQIQKEMEEERMKLEEEKNIRINRTKEHVKVMMATRDYYRDRRIKREEIVAKEFSKEAVRELHIEQEDRNTAKKELKRSLDTYLDYLKKLDNYNKIQEFEMQGIIDAMIKEQYIKDNETHKKEHLEKQVLLRDVLAVRSQQIDERNVERKKEEIKRQKELEYFQEDWKKYLREEQSAKEIQAKRREQYRRDLDCQVEHQNTLKQRQSDEIFLKSRLN